MEIIYLKEDMQLHMTDSIVAAIGFFDGLHVGHMALVEEVKRVADTKHYHKALITFDHYPLYVLGKLKEEKCLTSIDDRYEILKKRGFDYLFVIEFTPKVAALSPQEFIQKYLIECGIKHVVCGFDFRFGAKNQGDAKTLQESFGFNVSVIDEVIYKGEKISSTRIRQHLENGQMKDLNELLGRQYCVHGQVVHGRHIGHEIGFPTANIDYGSYFLPCGGVYAVKVIINQNTYMGMCNIGYNPTFQPLDKASLEVHILDFNHDIYGKEIYVEFYDLIRKEKPFHSKEELIQQLYKDREYVREYFSQIAKEIN